MRRYGRKPDSPDPLDRRYSAENPRAATVEIKESTDFEKQFPACWDQGEYSSCGPHSMSAFLHFLYPKVPAFSRFQIYKNVRMIEGSGDNDEGVETRDLFKVAQLTGAAPETFWPYDKKHYAPDPPDSVYDQAEKYTIESYSRLVAERSYLACLSLGHCFILGFNILADFDTDDLARTGVMPMPAKGAKDTGSGHDVLVIGHTLKLKQHPDFKASGLDPVRVSDKALKIRNSWGPKWGLRGHFWMPLDYATNPRTGGDAWTGSRA